MTTLLLDIGNSRLKWGLLVDNEIDTTGSVNLDMLKQQGFEAVRDSLPEHFDSVIACNVAGAEVAAGLASLGEIRFTSTTAEALGVTNSYGRPTDLGVDRWVAMIGARATTNTACLIVDAGTAITLDALDSAGTHLGGQILPGLRLMANALRDCTSSLPQVDPDSGHDDARTAAFAACTRGAISQGILGAAAGAIERGYRALNDTCPDAELILTGGDAAIIRGSLQYEVQMRPSLVLEGLAAISQAEFSE